MRWIGPLLVVIVATSGRAQPPRLAIAHANVVDIVDGRIDTDRTILIAEGRIVSVGEVPTPRAAAIVDAHGAYVVPGLWDMHTHLQMSGDSALSLYVANGVTGVRDMGSDLGAILQLRASTASGGIAGPRIVAAGPILDDAPDTFPFRLRVHTAEDGTAAVRLLQARGVDFVKVHDRTPRDAYFAIAAEARRQHLPLAGHLPRSVTIEEAIEAG